MQNTEIEKAIPWNPWHGCKKASPGCKNCFVFKMDKRYGRDTTIITKGKTTYELKDKDCPPIRWLSCVFLPISSSRKLTNGEKVAGILFVAEKTAFL